MIWFLMTGALLALGLDAWTTAQNRRTRFRAGTGARHRQPGLPSVYKRRRAGKLVLTFDNRPAKPLIPAITYADRLQAIDLDTLRQFAAGPLLPQAVAA